MRRRTARWKIILVAAVGWPAARARANLDAPGVHVTVYSDVCTNPGSAEALGERMILVTTKTTLMMFQRIEAGKVSEPVWAEPHMDGSKITFTLRDPQGGPASFAGTISAQEIAGSFSSSGKVFHLPHRPSITEIGQCSEKK